MAASNDSSRFDRLSSYLEEDPDNLALIGDAAAAALEESRLVETEALIARYRDLAELPPSLLHVEGMAALRTGDLARARAAFEAVRAEGQDQPGVRFNLAWLAALGGRHEDVLVLTDDAVIEVAPRAAALRVQALHHLGDIEGAVELGRQLLERLPEDDDLLGAASVAAMDADDYALAADLAGRAKGGGDALTTQGLVALNEDDLPSALTLFDRALAVHPEAPRAWIGKGLTLLAAGQVDAAAPALEKGAGIFGDHLGAWVAAGWAQFMRNDLAAARRDFEVALAHDENFAELHGGLAVIDLVEGDIEGAKRRTDIAQRLDRNCFGAALARILLLELEGKPEQAGKIRDRMLNLPVGLDGRTLAQSVIGIGMKPDGRLQ